MTRKLTVAVLALVIALYRNQQTVDLEQVTALKN